MSTIDVGLLRNGIGRGARDTAGSTDAPLRVVLVEGEALKLPRGSSQMRVLTGAAWVSQAGRDSLLQAGELFRPEASTDAAVVSALGSVPLLLEIR